MDGSNDTQMLDHRQKTTLMVRKIKEVEVKPPVTLEPFKNLHPSAGYREILMTLVQDMCHIYLALLLIFLNKGQQKPV